MHVTPRWIQIDIENSKFNVHLNGATASITGLSGLGFYSNIWQVADKLMDTYGVTRIIAVVSDAHLRLLERKLPDYLEVRKSQDVIQSGEKMVEIELWKK